MCREHCYYRWKATFFSVSVTKHSDINNAANYNDCFSPGHNRSMAEEYTTATETESVISSRHSGKFVYPSSTCLFVDVVLLHLIFVLFCNSLCSLCFAMKRGTYCPALAVCIVKLMKNMIALMVSLLAWLFCRLLLH